MDVIKFLILKKQDSVYKDITKDVAECYLHQNEYIVTMHSGKTFKYPSNCLIIEKLISTLNCDKYCYYYKEKRINNVHKLLNFGEWIRVIYKDNSNMFYRKKDVTIKSAIQSSNSASFIDYLKEIVNFLENEENLTKTEEESIGFLSKQFQNGIKMDRTILKKIINEIKITRNPTNNQQIIMPFNYNESQKKAVLNALENPISFIQGPPGTGKTQAILNILATLVYKNKKVAVVAGNNEAIRNVQEKLATLQLDKISAFLGNKNNADDFFSKSQNQSKIPHS